MTKQLQIHIDELEYTREGLRTREAIPLELGVHNQVRIVRPTRLRPVPIGYGSFGHDSAFPNPGVASVALIAALEALAGVLGTDPPSSIHQFFGHAEPSGDEDHNKDLSDRRAAAVKALFVGDVAALRDLGDQDGWGTKEHQIMLRTLRCDPGPIDGEGGPLTEAATRMFQREYQDGVFQRHTGQAPLVPQLADDGVLGGTTLDALYDAYVQSLSPRLSGERLHPTHPVVGCSEFNQAFLDEPVYSRRVSLVTYATLPPHSDRAPCTQGDHSVCPIDDNDDRIRCLWYREHVAELRKQDLVHRHFDLRWLSLPNDKVLLSALTTLPEEGEVTFRVYRTKPIADEAEIDEANLAEAVSDEMKGIVRGGVAQVLWETPSDFELFANGAEPLDFTDVASLRTATPRARLPVFRVTGGGAQALSPPPGREVGRLPGQPHENDDGSGTGFAALDWFGRLFHHGAHEEQREGELLHPLRDGEPRIRAIRHSTQTVG